MFLSLGEIYKISEFYQTCSKQKHHLIARRYQLVYTTESEIASKPLTGPKSLKLAYVVDHYQAPKFQNCG